MVFKGYLYMYRVRGMTSGPRLTEATLDVLEVLLSGDEELYGLKIARVIGRPTGSVFPILARLEETGWATSEWEEGDRAARGPRRRFYRLDPRHVAEVRDLVAARRPAAPARWGTLRPGLGMGGGQ